MGIFEEQKHREEEEEKKKKKKKKRKKSKKGMDGYDFIRICMECYGLLHGFLDFCMDISMFHY